MGVWYFNFRDEQDWAEAGAQALADEVRGVLSKQMCALVAIAGGRTPAAIMKRFVALDLPWRRLRFVPTDDRCVGDDHPARNLSRLREWLTPVLPDGARLTSLESLTGDETPDAILLGLGGDGHIASLFPSDEGMRAAWRAGQQSALAYVTPHPLPAEAPFRRVTFTMDALLNPRRIILAGTGLDKCSALERARAAEPEDTPLAALLSQGLTPVSVYTCASMRSAGTSDCIIAHSA